MISYFNTDKYSKEYFPIPDIKDPEEKKLAYAVAYAEAIYSLYTQDKCGLYYSAREDYYNLRLYGNGNQPEEFYKNYLIGEEDTDKQDDQSYYDDVDGKGGFTQTPTGKRKAYMNVLWKIVSIAPKVRSSLIGKFSRADYDVVATPIDHESGVEMEDEKYKLWFWKENLAFINSLKKKIPIPMKEPDFIPETMHELELYKQRGGFKPEYCKEMEKVISHTFNISGFDEIKDNMMTDAIDLGVMAAKEYYCEKEKKYKIRWVDPENSVVQYSAYNDYRDAEFFGEHRLVTISEIRPKLEAAGFEEKDIKSIAHSYMGYEGNPKPTSDEWIKYGKPHESESGYGYDSFKVLVADYEWFDVDGKQELIHTNNSGLKKVIPQKYGTKNKNNSNNKVITSYNKTMYKASWIVGTKFAYDYGKAHDIVMGYDDNDVKSSYHFYKLSSKSITEQLIPLYDNFQVLWLKYQNAIAMATNAGYAINITSIMNTTKGGAKGEETEVIKRLLQSGYFFFKETNGMNVRNSNMKPIYELPGGMGKIFDDVIRGFQFNIQLVENTTGISPIALGTVDPTAPVGTSELSYQNTQDTLRPILMGYSSIKETLSTNIALWVQMKVDYDKGVVEAYKRVIGKNGVKILQIANGKSTKYGISLEAQPTEAELKEVYESAKGAVMSRRNGEAGITEADFFMIIQILQSGGSLKQAEMLLDDRIRRNQKERDEIAKENMKMQQDYALMTEDKKAKASMDEIRYQNMADIKLEYAKAVFEVMIKAPDKQMRDAEMVDINRFYDQLMATTQQQGQQQPQTQQQPQQ